ncbi:hypothetical protein YDYSY3_16520 [Paenibacillus chitinolyticus]|nr:hypothetical protein YDYSY3_16520 [Paenibacillus chitinolyticus]
MGEAPITLRIQYMLSCSAFRRVPEGGPGEESSPVEYSFVLTTCPASQDDEAGFILP